MEWLKASLSVATGHRDMAYRVYGPEQDVSWSGHRLDDIIGNPRRLHSVTLCIAEQFDYILHKYIA